MTLRRALVAAALVALGIGAGVAYGYVKSAKPPKCKANACVLFVADGQVVGTPKNVVSVLRTGTGIYCVELKPNMLATGGVPAVATVDNDASAGLANVAVLNGPCGTNGLEFRNYNRDGGTSVLQDAAMSVVIP